MKHHVWRTVLTLVSSSRRSATFVISMLQHRVREGHENAFGVGGGLPGHADI